MRAHRVIPESDEMDPMAAEEGKQSIFISSAQHVVLALVVLWLDIVVFVCDLKPIPEHLDGEVGDTELQME